MVTDRVVLRRDGKVVNVVVHGEGKPLPAAWAGLEVIRPQSEAELRELLAGWGADEDGGDE
jgi:hypothetical protein